jgi:hypothetical protein
MGNPGPALDGDFSDQAVAGGLSTFMCPLCSAVSLGIALLFCLGWMLRRQRPPRLGGEQRSKAPPRSCWPALNPRAPPLG